MCLTLGRGKVTEELLSFNRVYTARILWRPETSSPLQMGGGSVGYHRTVPLVYESIIFAGVATPSSRHVAELASYKWP